MSDSVLMIARLTSLPGVMDVRRRFSICLSLEKERSALQLVTIKTKYILSAITTLEKVSCTPLSIISLYKKQLSADVFWLIVSEYISKLGKVT